MESREIKNLVGGEVLTNELDLTKYSHDASIFEVVPSVAVKPKNVDDLKKLVKFVAENKAANPELSLTARSGGTDMTGGPLNESIIFGFANFNKIIEVNEQGYTITEPGVYYRDFEKATLAKGWLLPSYPASKEICTIGGMIANNSGGEKSLKYGKTDNYVEELDVVLADGGEYTIKSLSPQELEQKKTLPGLEGKIYTEMHDLLESNYDLIQQARPKVSKNSAGYALWNVWDRKNFDLTKLFVGSQGTLGLVTKIKLKLIKPAKFSKMLVIFLKDLKPLADLVGLVMESHPESFESYDRHTLKLAIRFMPEIIRKMKGNGLMLMLRFLPELGMILGGGLPELVLLAEFTGDSEDGIYNKIADLQARVRSEFKLKTRIAKNPDDAQKYWTIRRESFNLLRKHVQGKKSAPFIDDIIVPPAKLAEFLPKLQQILGNYKTLTYTIAGHAGDGNFHIIPLMDLSDPASRKIIEELSEKVYDLVIEFGGSITAEHNDGLIRTPFLNKMYGPEICRLFEETKKIFDPQNIFNPRKKVWGDMQYAMNHIKND